MPTHTLSLRATVGAGLLALLSACGGSNDPVVVNTPATVSPSAQFATSYGNGVAALNTVAGLTNAAFLDTIDDGFLDAGYTKPQLRNQLSQEATARATTPSLVFPGVTLSNIAISGCNANGICTMTATATNSDVDTTSTTFTTQVRLTNNVYRVYGDQAQAPAV